MTTYSTTYHGNPSIGLFAFSTDENAFVSPDAPGKFVYAVKTRLDVDVIKTTICESNLLGIYGRAYKNIVMVSSMITEKEESTLRKDAELLIKIKTKWNAVANNIVFNDKGAIINPLLDKSVETEIKDALGIDVIRSKIAGYPTVGSTIVLTDKGGIIHYKASDDEVDMVKDVLKLKYKPIKTTINLGSGFVRIGIINNNKGYVVGDKTTGIEISRIEEGLYSD